MHLSKYSNRELVKELTSRQDFEGCVLHFKRELGRPVDDQSQAIIAVSKPLATDKAIRLLKAAVRAMERSLKGTDAPAIDTGLDNNSTAASTPPTLGSSIPKPHSPSEDGLFPLINPLSFISLRRRSD